MKKCPICGYQKEGFIEGASGDLWICDCCGSAIFNFLIIKIIKEPKGPEPEWIRQILVGLRFLAEPFDGSKAKLFDDEKMKNKQRFIVPKGMAMDVLGEVSLEAVRWYNLNFPKYLENLLFAFDEAEVVNNGSMIAPLAFIEGTEVH